MTAFAGKADMAVGACLLSWSLLGVKRTCLFALHMSAFDPKRTSADLTSLFSCPGLSGLFLWGLKEQIGKSHAALP